MVERWVVRVEVKKASFWLERIMSGEAAKGYLNALGSGEEAGDVEEGMGVLRERTKMDGLDLSKLVRQVKSASVLEGDELTRLTPAGLSESEAAPQSQCRVTITADHSRSFPSFAIDEEV